MSIFKKISRAITWLFSRNVLDAINNGATYEEVAAIVDKEAE